MADTTAAHLADAAQLNAHALRTGDRFFRDVAGRAVHLRGVNVAPNAKTPAAQPSHVGGAEFFDDASQHNVSFVGQPFALEAADEHFARLRRWGFNFLRFNFTWEGIEHGGPGVYDEAYIAYLIDVLKKARAHGFRCFMDPHQDVWSRWTGGDGAPMWTLDLAGFEPRNFNETGAALVHNTFPGDKHDFPMMIWPTNYRKLAASTMFTLFWAGKTLAPRLMVDRPPCMGTGEPVNIQDHLQISYLRCLFLVARAISEAGLQDSCVIGYDTFNEPNEGLLGVTDIAKQMKGQTMNGDSPTPFEAMCLGEGIACDVDEWKMGTFGPYRSGRKRIDPNGVRAWKPGKGCIWKQHGVWTTSAADKGNASGHGPQVLLPDYFNKNPITGETIDIERDFVQPFFYRVAAVVRSAHADAVIFIEPRVMAPPPEDWHERAVAEYGSKDTVARAAIFAGKDRDAAGSAKNPAIKMHLGDRRIAYTPHWYDGMTLVNKHFRPWFNVDVLSVLRAAEQGHTVPWYAIVRFGEYYVRHVFADNVMRLAQDGWHALKGNVPVVFGEFGLPYDMVSKIAYSSGDYQLHEQALDAYFNAMEHTRLDTTLWNYCASNTNEWGDNWNGEDLSIFSLDVHPDHEPANAPRHGFSPLDRGGRALNAVCRPFATAVAGTPLKTEFEMSAKRYELEFEHLKDGSDNVDEEGETRLSSRVSEVFLPRWHYPSKADVLVKVSHGKWKIVEEPGPSLPSGESDAILKLIWDCGCPLEDGGSDAPGNGSGGSAMDDESAGLVRKKEGAKVKHTIVVTRRGHRDPRGRWEMPAKVGLAVLVAGLAYLSYTLMSSKT